MIRQFAVAVLSAGALAACVPYTDGMTPYSTGYANPLTQALAAATQPYGYGQAAPYGYGQQPAPYGYGYQAAPAPVYAPQPVYMPQAQPQVVYMPQQATAPGYGYGYGGGRSMAPGMRRAAADRDGNGVPDWRERDRNGDGTLDYQQRQRRFR